MLACLLFGKILTHKWKLFLRCLFGIKCVLGRYKARTGTHHNPLLFGKIFGCLNSSKRWLCFWAQCWDKFAFLPWQIEICCFLVGWSFDFFVYSSLAPHIKITEPIFSNPFLLLITQKKPHILSFFKKLVLEKVNYARKLCKNNL